MGVVREAVAVRLDPERAFQLWIDVRRWSTFVDGFARAKSIDETWPAEGAKLVWESTPDGRGIVTERVIESLPAGVLATEVFEERYTGVQTVTFEPADEGEGDGAVVEIELDYELSKGGALRGVTDVLFIRRAQSDALVRTLRRFATEAAEEAAL
jgi:Polyketide cyclase / dehydrase and lipid transport